MSARQVSHTQDGMAVTLDYSRLPAVVGIYVAEGWWRDVVDEARRIAGSAWPSCARITVEFRPPASRQRPDPAKVAAAVIAAAAR